MNSKFTFSRDAIFAFAIAFCATAWCWWATGGGLGLFFGGILLSVFYVPFLCASDRKSNRGTGLGAFGLAICGCWCISLPWEDVTFLELVRCCLVCAAFIWAMGGLVSLFGKLKVPPPYSRALVSVVAILWLTWPVWLSHALTQQLVNVLVIAHPLMAINHVVIHLGAWDRAPIAYRQLTILNQDIPYHLPGTILPAVIVHGVIGLAGFLPRTPQPSPNIS